MHHKSKFCTLLIMTLIVSFSLYGTDLNINVLPYKKKLKEKILAGEIFSESKVKSLVLVENNKMQETQELRFSIAGLHQKSCDYALKKLALYENYSSFLDFVKKSEYDEKTSEINFLLSHPLLPYDMQMKFKLPRITKVGVYPFLFEEGILKNLKGNIYVIDHNKHCLFYSTAAWDGPSTGFSNIVFEFFSQTLAKLTMERLFRLSNTLSH